MSRKCLELKRLVIALSAACKQDQNVLKDSELVDRLEKYGHEITRVRPLNLKTRLPRHSRHKKTSKKIEEKSESEKKKATDATPKRRKLSMDTETKSEEDALDYNHHCDTMSMFPSIERQKKPKRVCTGERSGSIQHSNKKAGRLMDYATDVVDCYRPTTVAVAINASEEAIMVNPLKTRQHDHMRRSVSPQQKTLHAGRVAAAALPYKQLDRAPSPNSVDLLESSASTMASYYDDMYDEYAACPEMMQSYTRSAFDRTSSFESMDWTRSDDGSSDESMQFRSIADDVGQRPLVSRVVAQRSIHAAGTRINHLHPEHSTEAYYLTEKNEPIAGSSSHVASVTQKRNPPVAPSSTEVVMEVLYGIMEHNENFKWLIDPVNQARVATLVEYHMRAKQNDDVSTQAYEDKQFVSEVRAHVDKLIHENLKMKTENLRLMGKSSQSAAVDKNAEELQRRLAMSEEAISMQKEYRREAEATFQRELETKSKLVSSLQHDLEKKDLQIASLLENGAELRANGDMNRNPEVCSLKNAMMEKNREICRLNFQLSTKQKLVDEIAKKVIQHMGTTLNISSGEILATLANGLRVDVDKFLYESLAKKQETIDELKAALLSMEHEVSGLEARVAKKVRDALLLKTKFKSLSSRLTESNVNISRVQAENECLVTSLKEKQGKMHDLLEFLEGKEKQVMHLEEQVKLSQTQLEHVMTEYEKMQRHQFDKKSTSGHHLSHCKTNVHAQ
ncbi:unnamed protein product [Peronospora belbahrii]|uniref:Uncharacterized protein n=1 Tax=Peronospora belbahrii TaxID=622444 RepID=A0AAU9L690_9STRA|nr:unnamed protein product [Peronospora belbahrii]